VTKQKLHVKINDFSGSDDNACSTLHALYKACDVMMSSTVTAVTEQKTAELNTQKTCCNADNAVRLSRTHLHKVTPKVLRVNKLH